ncbi:TetR/AcrR family transcriptional regulator [Lactiplantibacillus mudanjiangensis]|uniref:TetR family transcriptional regulator [Lactobacillus allii] n=1 Tax=Lactiplantibacillus mudanjiangensis TaxID=1296538 RepID=A0A660E1U5_9LACO|nr:TetR/AcrR family transcriptional regulator [Lactiplantibacillus mudanjiangensis]VDG22717.1 TetR family transcriptional regulator [Lactobacillus allii] [Lactiplantibacillus mudanjiangensis]VDG26745.1 TetR family transcriptional regulator [Lactobacillus allii] [Lactiplantibacillus mudanjiangensis]
MTYSGTNPTVRQSKERLADAMAYLLLEDSYTQITISKICKRAATSRQTFYNLFDSKDDLLKYYLEATMKTMFAPLWRQKDQSPDHLIEMIVSYVDLNRTFLCLLVENSLQAVLQEAIQIGIAELTASESITYAKYRTAFVAGGMTQTIIEWLTQPNSESASEIASVLAEMINTLHQRL